MSELTHLDAEGRARMVDVGDKPATERRAVARALVRVSAETAARVARGRIELTAEARTTGPTGVEMEALTAVSVAALTVYDMVKGIERGAEIAEVALTAKSGGRSGEWRRRETA